MKKIFSAIAIIASLILSFSAMAMQTIGDNELSKVTGQSGVSIGIDVTVDMDFDVVAWGDSDGFEGYTEAGWVGLADGAISTLRIRSRSGAAAAGLITNLTTAEWALMLSDLGYADQAAWAADGTLGQARAIAWANQFLTIDVGSNGAVTKVRIGLPTAQIEMASLDATLILAVDDSGVPSSTVQTMGALYVGGMNVLVGRNGYVDIYANGGGGIALDLAAQLETVTIDAVSYGDLDGLAFASTNTAAGYVGLTGMTVSGISTNLSVLIDVATATAADYAAALAVLSSDATARKVFTMYTKSEAGQCGATWVNIGLTGSVSVASFAAQAELGAAKTLADGQVLGQLYASGIGVQIGTATSSGNTSWVSISAH